MMAGHWWVKEIRNKSLVGHGKGVGEKSYEGFCCPTGNLSKISEKFFHFSGYKSHCYKVASTIIVDLILQHCNSSPAIIFCYIAQGEAFI